MLAARAKYFVLGLISGLFFPALVFMFESALGISPVISGKKNMLYLISLALDLIALRIALRWQNDIIKGIASAMFISALLIFIYRFPG